MKTFHQLLIDRMPESASRLGGVSGPGWGEGWWCAWSGGGGGVLPQCLVGYHHPPCEQNDKQVQKYYLGHNFFAAGKNYLLNCVHNF